MDVDCEFIRECEVNAKRFKNQLALDQLNQDANLRIDRDPCLPDVPEPEPYTLRHQFYPLPRHYLKKPDLGTYSPVAKCENVTMNKFFYYPKPVYPVKLVKPNYFHYKPTNIFTGVSTYNYAYRPFVVIDEFRRVPVSLLPPNLYQKKKKVEPPRKECETTTKFYFYEKEVKPRNRSRLWWQMGKTYATPTIQVESETSTASTYKVPPYSKPIRNAKPKGNIYFGEYRLRT